MRNIAIALAAAIVATMPADAADYAFDASIGCNSATCVFGFYDAPAAFTFADGDTILLSGDAINLEIDSGRRLGGFATLGTRFGAPPAVFSGAPITATIKLFDGNDSLLGTGVSTLASNASVATPGRTGVIFPLDGGGTGPIAPTRFEALFVANGGAVVNLSTVQVRLAAVVPEPGSWAMMIGGFGLLGAAARRRTRAAIAFA